MKKLVTIAMLVILAILISGILAGCTSTSTIKEFDEKGNLIKETTTNESVVEQVIASTKNKTVVAFREFYCVGLRAEPSTENFFSLQCAYMHKNTGVISILKDQQNLEHIAKMIYNMNKQIQ
jgi:hypothetical protein